MPFCRRLTTPITLAVALLGTGRAYPAAVAPRRAAKPAVVKPKPAPARKAASAESPAANTRPAPRFNTWALLVGVSKYQSPAVASLRYPASDATALRDALVDKQLGGLPAAHVRLLTDEEATASSITGAVDSFLKPNVKPGDQVVLFLAGHGVAKGVGLDARGFFLSTDVKGLTLPTLEASAVDLKALSGKLSELPAAQFVVFVDACREDPTPGRGVKGNTMSDVLSRGVQIVPRDTAHPAESASFFACSIGQRAFEDPTLKHGVFTYWILDALKTGDVPQRPDGAVDMGLLASYVRSRVIDWAKNASSHGDFEVEQTPEFVTSDLTEPIVLVHVQRPLPATTIAPAAPTVTVITEPAGARVSVDGAAIGAAPVMTPLPKGGKYTLRVETPGCPPVERPITAIAGYGLQVSINLPPGARDPSAGSAGTNDWYTRAQDAEARQQWEVAEAGYDAAVKADPKFSLAYERLADLRLRRGKTSEAIGTLVEMVSQVPDARAYSLLSRAYSLFATRAAASGQAGGDKSEPKRKKGGLLGSILGGGKRDRKQDDGKRGHDGEPANYAVPTDAAAAASLALRAADEAVKRDASMADAQAALGFALVVTDRDGKNKDDALAAFGKAVLLEPRNPAQQYAMGYGIRSFAQALKDETARKEELRRAVTSLRQALDLRPDYYEAHRELAFCYHLLDDLPAAQREYELANANRGAATDENEVAAVNLSLSGIHRQEAQNAQGERKADLLAASDGYMSDAKEISPNLEIAMRILSQAGVSTRLTDYLPPEVKRLMNLPGELENNVKSRLKFPFGR
jgi:tetratricopeptide (TPR) repeat protein